jgi:hypothetical protein
MSHEDALAGRMTDGSRGVAERRARRGAPAADEAMSAKATRRVTGRRRKNTKRKRSTERAGRSPEAVVEGFAGRVR